MKTFLEIGTCDFDTLNYLSDRGWRGIIVEPIKKYLDNIKRKERIHYYNAAVDWVDGTRKMYIAPDHIVNEDYDFAGMSSFYNISNVLTEEVIVPTITIKKILYDTNIVELDFLKIDTEGHDFEILQMVFNEKVFPKYLQAEIKHLTNVDELKKLLTTNGYHYTISGDNVFAILL